MIALPQNAGSWFLALCVAGCSAISAWGLTGIARLVGISEPIARRVGTGLGLVLLIAVGLPLRYSAVTLAPLLVVQGWLLAAWGLARVKRYARLPWLWAVLTAAYACGLGCSLWVADCAIGAADAVRHLSLDEVRRITIASLEKPEPPITITDQGELAQILETLEGTVPYVPERERFTNGYRVTIHTSRGPVRFALYRGRAGRPETAVLDLTPSISGPRLHLGYYENEPLYWLLVTRYRFPAWFDEAAQDLFP